jgi:hypothetical protein
MLILGKPFLERPFLFISLGKASLLNSGWLPASGRRFKLFYALVKNDQLNDSFPVLFPI